MFWMSVIFTLVYPYSDAFAYPTNPERFIVKCELRKYLREFKGIFHKLVDSVWRGGYLPSFMEHLTIKDEETVKEEAYDN